jgi:hypothetical protein
MVGRSLLPSTPLRKKYSAALPSAGMLEVMLARSLSDTMLTSSWVRAYGSYLSGDRSLWCGGSD